MDVEREAATIDSLVGVNTSSMTLTDLGDPVVMDVAQVTKGLLQTFRLAPVLGRDLRDEDFGAGRPALVVVGHDLWQSRLGGRRDVLGKTIVLNGKAYEIVGIAPEELDYPFGADLWIPRDLDPERCGRGCHTLLGVGRLRAGATLEEARVEVNRISSNLAEAYPETNAQKSFAIRSLRDQIVGNLRPGLLLLLGAVGLVLLIACANVANLLLVKASTRTGEIAIRTALGASRPRLVVQTLVESSLLALFGGLLGLIVAVSSLRLLSNLLSGLPRVESIGLDGATLSFTLVTLVVITVIFGGVPAFSLLRKPIRAGMTGLRGRDGASRGRRRFRNGLMAFETALAALLLVGAGLLLKTFVALYSVDVGFDRKDVTRFTVILPEVRYGSLEAIRSFYRSLEERIRAVPGVEDVGSVWGPPLGRGHATGDVIVSGRPEPPPSEARSASVHPIGPGFFSTMRIPIRKRTRSRRRRRRRSRAGGGDQRRFAREFFRRRTRSAREYGSR